MLGISVGLQAISACTATDKPAATHATSAVQSATPAADEEPLRLVGLGDSILTSADDDGHTLLDLYGEHLRAVTGGTVTVRNLADGSNTTQSVLDSLVAGSAAASAVAAAHLVVVTVGGNDADPFGHYPAGTCSPRSRPSDCLTAYAPDLSANLTRVLARVEELKPRDATLVITSPDFNPFIGWSEAPSRTFGVDFYRQVATAETALVCRLARETHARCLDLLHLLNGVDGTADAAPYLAADHAHPGAAGVKAIADALVTLLDE